MVAIILMAAFFVVSSAINEKEEGPYAGVSDHDLRKLCSFYDIDIRNDMTRREMILLLNEHVH